MKFFRGFRKKEDLFEGLFQSLEEKFHTPGEIDTGYRPQPKQKILHECKANEILYGGAAGPGKSHALRHEALNWCLRIPGLQVYLFRRTYPELEKNHILPSLAEFPRGYGKYRDQKRRWEFPNGSMIHFCHVQHEKDVFQYQGAEIHLLVIDELTTFTEFVYDYLCGRVRCALEIPDEYRHKIPGIVCASNPGGVGHEFVKRRWVDFAKPLELKRAQENQGGMLRCYIPGRLEDNPILTERDPGYIHRLDNLPEPYRTAYKEGDWDIFLGQAFHFSKDYHVIQPRPIPEWVQVYMTMDWGYGAPFSIGWWWVDNDGRIYRFAEDYGWNGTANQGLRLTDSEIAQRILEKEDEMGMGNRQIIRYCDPTCFNKKPDYRGGGQGPSTAEEFIKVNKRLALIPGDPSRTLKIRQFRERLLLPPGDQPPMLLVYENCQQFIRTIPLLQTDPNDVEDVDTTGEDHCYDEAALICMARPISHVPIDRRPLTDKRIEELTRPRSHEAMFEREMIIGGREDDYYDESMAELYGPEYDDGLDLPHDTEKYDVG
jgi:hypothetical protein